MQNFSKNLTATAIYSNSLCKVQHFTSAASSDVSFIVVPSIFNNSTLMFQPEGNSFIEQLAELGQVYFVQWQQVTSADIGINDYAQQLHNAIQQIPSSKQKIIVAHSFGSILSSLAIACEDTQELDAVFLAPPWDFSKFRNIVKLMRYTGLLNLLFCYKFIHTKWLTIALYLVNPGWVSRDIKQYFQTDDKKRFWQFKKWQFTGYKLSCKTAKQIVQNFIEQNQWPSSWLDSSDDLVDFSKFQGEVTVIYAAKDKIVPNSSTKQIEDVFKHFKSYSLDRGHVGLITGSKVHETIAIIKKTIKK